MNNVTITTAQRFAAALDNEDYGAAHELLEAKCEYLSPTGALVGPSAILDSYREAAIWAKSNIASVRYTSEVRWQDGDAVVTFYDHLEHAGAKHTYACEQRLSVNGEGRITRIVHRELPGERESADTFLRGIGLSRHFCSRPERDPA
jgi:hypothetical protein